MVTGMSIAASSADEGGTRWGIRLNGPSPAMASQAPRRRLLIDLAAVPPAGPNLTSGTSRAGFNSR